jgi:hypothetical protein
MGPVGQLEAQKRRKAMTVKKDIGWPEAVGRLAGARSKAETCAAMLKRYGDKQQIAQGQLDYGEGKANFDAVIAGLITALTEGGKPKSLPSLETDLGNGTHALQQFAHMVSKLTPSSSGRKDIIGDIAKATIKPVIDALSAAISALYNNHRKDDVLTRETIKTQLEATKWLSFAEVKAAE